MSTTTGSGQLPPNAYWVIPGRFAAGEYPGAKSHRDAAGKLRALMGAGINHFVDLTEPHELAPYAGIAEEEAAQLGLSIEHHRHSIRDVQVPRSRQEMAAILDAIDAALDDGRTVYVHCWGGIGRTGTAVGCWLVRRGRTGEEALAQVSDWWRGVEKAWRRPESPETPEQCDYVRNWTDPSTEGTA